MFKLSDYQMDIAMEPEVEGYVTIPLLLQPYIYKYILEEHQTSIVDPYTAMSGVSDNMQLPDDVSKEMEHFCNFGEFIISMVDFPGCVSLLSDWALIKQTLDKAKIPYFLQIKFNDNYSVFYSYLLNQQMQVPIRYDSNLLCFDPRSVNMYSYDVKQRAKEIAEALRPDWDFINQHMKKIMPVVTLADSIEPLTYWKQLHEDIQNVGSGS